MTRHILSFLTLLTFLNTTYGQRTIISGNIKNLPGKHNIRCSFITNSVLDNISEITIPVLDGSFTYVSDIKKTTFVSLGENKNYYAGFIQPGDSIVISYDAAGFSNTLSFSGKGNEKFNFVQQINKIKSDFTPVIALAKNKSFPVDYFFLKLDSTQSELSKQILLSKPLMGKESFNQINSYLASSVLSTKYFGLQDIFGDSYDNILQKQKIKLSATSKLNLRNLLNFNNSYATSYFYLRAVYNVLSVHYENNEMPNSSDNSLAKKYTYLQKMLPPNLKSPIFYLFLKNEIKTINNSTIEPIINKSFPLTKDSLYKINILRILADSRKLKNGSQAPDFSLEDKNGNKVTLASFKGKIIYMDFWFAACTPCHKLFEETKEAKKYFTPDSNVVWLMVSIDSRDIWENAVKKFNIQGYHVFTENKLRDHPVIKAYNVTEYPTTYLIDRNGRILNINPPHDSDELIKEIEMALRTVSN
ncbi:MAG: redoxin domain-containing protein [Chitinophagaceae bacterium]